MGDREAFLNRIAARLGKPRRRSRPEPVRLEGPGRLGMRPPEAPASLFLENWEKAGGAVVGEPAEAALPALVARHAVREALVGGLSRPIDGREGPDDGPAALSTAEPSGSGDLLEAAPAAREALLSAALTLRRLGVDVRPERGADRTFAARATLGVVAADAAIAETGSVVFLTSATAGRTASLLPPVLWIVVSRATVYPTLGEALHALAERGRKDGFPSAIQIVTGPSRSADIEMQLTLGVHGPGTVWAQLV
ncbi:LUD domain-containing protein [Hydrogenibacillus sp. N12]|uniref:LutC/YkgG family protein n=1 Tax=Hydrogenibacillus sp. N12 TaxID=2866627 RepID=UPI00207BFC9F|nr:LUD domain-containing protein [Hydrogenibacillus sp. N12]